MKAGIIIDYWKLSIFESHLKRAGYVYNVGPGITAETKLITVVFEDKDAVEKVVREANTTAARTKGR